MVYESKTIVIPRDASLNDYETWSLEQMTRVTTIKFSQVLDDSCYSSLLGATKHQLQAQPFMVG